MEGVEIVLLPETVKSLDEVAKEKKRVSAADYVANNGIDAYVGMYFEILTGTHVEIYKQFFRHLLDKPSENVLFHCAAGKDRTGVLSSLILKLVGASDEEIALDYMYTRVGIESQREELMKGLVGYLGKEVCEETWGEPGMLRLCGIDRGNVLGMLEKVGEVWGGVEGYLGDVLGFEGEEIQRIKGRLRAG